MVHFITGRPGSGKSTLLLEALYRRLEEGGQALLLVPEQQTVLWETKLALSMPEKWQRQLEVTNFTRLANTVFRQYGGLARERIDDGGRGLVLWRAMLSVWDMLQVYNRSADGREDRNIPVLLSALGELKQNGITPADVDKAVEALTADEDTAASTFARRLADVSLIYSAYESMLHTEYSDRDDIMTALADTLETHDFFRGKAVFVDSFYSVTRPELRILHTVMAGAAEMYVTFACRGNKDDALPFVRIRRFLRQMERIAADLGKTPVHTALTADHRHTTPGLRAIMAGLFADAMVQEDGLLPPETQTDCPPDVTVYQCADRYEEAEAAAARIHELVRRGCRYGDIAVVARHMDKLQGILDTVLRRQDIPCFLAQADPLSASPAVRLLTSLLAVESGGYNRRDLLRMIATGLTPITATEADCFAAYTETWNIRGRTMFCGDNPEEGTFTWHWNPDGYRTEVSPWGKICLREANRAREKLMPHVAAFSALFRMPEKHGKESGRVTRKTASVAEICRGLVQFALAIKLPDRLQERAETLIREGKREDGAKTRLVWQNICEGLDKMVSLLGDVHLDAGRFSGLFSRVIDSMDLGAIPTAMDEVLLGSADGIRFGEVRHMILVGAVEGEFPADISNVGFFGDSDRILLEGAGVSLTGSREEYLAEEYWMFYRTAVSATESLTILCPHTDGGEACVPSAGTAGILACTGIQPVPWHSLPLEKRVYHPAARPLLHKDEDREALAALRRMRPEEALPYTPGMMDASGDMADSGYMAAYFGSRMRLTQSRLDSFTTCPFRYWCQYGMALKEAPRAVIQAPDIGNFIHVILEQFFRCTKGRTYPLPEKETEELSETLITEYLRRLGIEQRDGRLQYLFLRLRRHVSIFLEAIMTELGQGKFEPLAFELPVGLADTGEGQVNPVTLEAADGLSVTLCGIIDRVDIYTASDGQKYVRVVDYKTGSRRFSLADIYEGFHVQLLLYLFSLWQGGYKTEGGRTEEKIQPAGAVYFQLRPGEEASDRMLSPEEGRMRALDAIGRSGIWLRDEEILEAQDAGLSGRYVPVTRKKDGGFTGRAILQDLAQFGSLYQELKKIIADIAGKMTSGLSAASPRESYGTSPCQYCPYTAVCRRRG